MMDEVEKNIVRRRRSDLYDCLAVTRDVVTSLRNKSLLLPEHVTAIDQEATNNGKVDRVVDSIIQLGPPDGFKNFCKILSRLSPTLAAEFEVELGLERGIIQPRPEMIDEATALVNRKFSRSRRFSEADRKEVVELIAAKLQLAHDEWKREADKVQTQLDQVRLETNSLDDQSARVVRLLANFTGQYESSILKYARDPKATRQVLRQVSTAQPCMGAIQTLEQLLSNMRQLFKQVELILDHRDKLYSEKERCLRLLEISDDKVQLDDVIGKMSGLSITSNLGVERKDDIIARLERMSSELDQEADRYDKEIERLRVTLAAKERELADLRHNVYID